MKMTLKAIITMVALDSNSFALADKIVEQNNPGKVSLLCSPYSGGLFHLFFNLIKQWCQIKQGSGRQ